MPNESKRSGEKATGLLSGQFHQARIRLTFVYVSILAAILILSSGSTYSFFSSRLEYRFARFRPRMQAALPVDGVSPTQAEVRTDLINSLLIVNGFLLVAAGISSYWLAGVTLRPIQDAYNRQRRFLSDASHELRTPLAILQTDLENERIENGITAINRKRIESHLEEVERMSLLVGDLLTLSRLDEGGESQKQFSVVNVSDIIRETVERLQPIAKHHAITLSFSRPEKAIEVLATKGLMSQALCNVVKNAIVYNTVGGTVAVTSKVEDGQATIRIIDTGIGIAKEDVGRIFDRFYRTDQSRSRQTGGSGLGLAIVQSIMTQLNGSVQIESTPGQGTVVTLRLPTSKAS